jgi:beta-glucosidase
VLKSKDVELVAGKPYSIRIDYINCGLDPQVRLLWSVPECDYHTNALEIAQKGEVIVMALGLSPTLEGEEMPVNIEGFYGGDRTDIRLPQPQLRLLQEVHALGKPIVLVLLNGSALGIPWAAENIPAIVEAWYPGQAGGLALADVLFGDYNPSGRLPLTFYRSIDDLPPFDDYNMEGRTYRYFHGEPLYAFGHGLSYTSFTYRNIERSKTQICGGEKITIRCEVTNVGACSGDEVVQIYLRQNAISEQPAIKELKGFVRLHLIPGECRQVAFTLGAAQLRSYQGELGWQVLPGRVEVMIGGSSVDLPVSTSFEVVGAPVPAQYPEKYLSQIEIK